MGSRNCAYQIPAKPTKMANETTENSKALLSLSLALTPWAPIKLPIPATQPRQRKPEGLYETDGYEEITVTAVPYNTSQIHQSDCLRVVRTRN
jgi:hypothetical protein